MSDPISSQTELDIFRALAERDDAVSVSQLAEQLSITSPPPTTRLSPSMKTGDDGVAIITWDVPGKSMNVMSATGFQELDALIDEVLSSDDIKGAVITSAKKDFAGGMDLNVLASIRNASDNPAKDFFDHLMASHGVRGGTTLAVFFLPTQTDGMTIS